MRVPPTGLPVLVPQSLGGEYRALPDVPNAAARVAFDLRDLADVSQLEVFRTP